jgi:biotin operon repressor
MLNPDEELPAPSLFTKKQLAREFGTTSKAVTKHLKFLKRIGVISLQRRGKYYEMRVIDQSLLEISKIIHNR